MSLGALARQTIPKRASRRLLLVHRHSHHGWHQALLVLKGRTPARRGVALVTRLGIHAVGRYTLDVSLVLLWRHSLT